MTATGFAFGQGPALSRGTAAPLAVGYDVVADGVAVAAVVSYDLGSLDLVGVTAQVRAQSARVTKAELRAYEGSTYPEDWRDGRLVAPITLGAADSLAVHASDQITTSFEPHNPGPHVFAIVVFGTNLVQPIGGPPLSTTGGTYAQNKLGAGIAVGQGTGSPLTGTAELYTPMRTCVYRSLEDANRPAGMPYALNYPAPAQGDPYVVPAYAWIDGVQVGDLVAAVPNGGVMADVGTGVSVTMEMRFYRPGEAAAAIGGAWEVAGTQMWVLGPHAAGDGSGDQNGRSYWGLTGDTSAYTSADVGGRWLVALLVRGSNITQPTGNDANISLQALAQWSDYDTVTRNAPDSPYPIPDDNTGTPPDEEPPEDGEVFEEGEDYSQAVPCPPHYRRVVASHAPSAVPRLGKAAAYRVQINRRGGAIQELDIPPQAITSVSWERRVNDVAEHTIEVSKRWPDALRAIELCECWTHELAIWRVPEYGQPEIVAVGPFLDYTESRSSVTLVGADMGAWFGKRVIHNDFDFSGCADLAEIARVLINDGMGPDDPGLLPYAKFIATGISAQRSGAAFRLNLDKELGDMAEQGLDWTFVGRRLYVSGDLAAQWPHVARLGERHFDEDVEINGAGKEALTRVFKTNAESSDVYIGMAGGIDPVLGLLETTDNSDDVTDNATARVAAQVALAAGYPVPYYVRVPDGASLTADAPVTIGQLIPGVGMQVEITSYLKPRVGLQRLTQVRTTWNAEEGEQIAVSLSPWAGVVIGDDVSRVATVDELGTTDYDTETEPEQRLQDGDDYDTTEGATAEPTEPVYGDKDIGEVRSTYNLGHFGSTETVSYPNERVWADQTVTGKKYPGRYGYPYLLATKTLTMIAGDRLYLTGSLYYFESLAAGQLSLQLWIAAGSSIALGQGNKEFEGAYKTVGDPSDDPDPSKHGFTLLDLVDTGRWPNPEFDGQLFGYPGWCPFDVPASGTYTIGLVVAGPGGGWQHSPALAQDMPEGSSASLYTARRTPKTEVRVTAGTAITLTMTVEVPRGGVYTLEGQQPIGAIADPGGSVSCYVFYVEGSTAPSAEEMTTPGADMNKWTYVAGGTVSAPGNGTASFAWGPGPMPNYYSGPKTYTFFIACYGTGEWDEGSGAAAARYLKLTGKNVLLEEGSSGETTEGSTSDVTIQPVGPTDTADTAVNATATTDDGTIGTPVTSDDDDDMSTNPGSDPQTNTIGDPENPTDEGV